MIVETASDGSSATFSDCRAFRYHLKRLVFSTGAPSPLSEPLSVTFIMLNPSIADAFKNDPTISKCREFVWHWGCNILEVVNLFPFRSPDPKVLKAAENRMGDAWENDHVIVSVAKRAQIVMAAWGNGGEIDGRAGKVAVLLRANAISTMCLGTTDSGAPLHPLARGKAYIPMTTEPVPFVWGAA